MSWDDDDDFWSGDSDSSSDSDEGSWWSGGGDSWWSSSDSSSSDDSSDDGDSSSVWDTVSDWFGSRDSDAGQESRDSDSGIDVGKVVGIAALGVAAAVIAAAASSTEKSAGDTSAPERESEPTGWFQDAVDRVRSVFSGSDDDSSVAADDGSFSLAETRADRKSAAAYVETRPVKISRSPQEIAERLFRVFGRIVPARIANEEFGDALELIHCKVLVGCCSSWWLWGKLFATLFFVLVATIRERSRGSGRMKGG